VSEPQYRAIHGLGVVAGALQQVLDNDCLTFFSLVPHFSCLLLPLLYLPTSFNKLLISFCYVQSTVPEAPKNP
jgi:hypothetical protein